MMWQASLVLGCSFWVLEREESPRHDTTSHVTWVIWAQSRARFQLTILKVDTFSGSPLSLSLMYHFPCEPENHVACRILQNSHLPPQQKIRASLLSFFLHLWRRGARENNTSLVYRGRPPEWTVSRNRCRPPSSATNEEASRPRGDLTGQSMQPSGRLNPSKPQTFAF